MKESGDLKIKIKNTKSKKPDKNGEDLEQNGHENGRGNGEIEQSAGLSPSEKQNQEEVQKPDDRDQIENGEVEVELPNGDVVQTEEVQIDTERALNDDINGQVVVGKDKDDHEVDGEANGKE